MTICFETPFWVRDWLTRRLTEFFVLLAKAGVDFGVGCVVEVAVFLESGDGGVDDGVAVLAGLDAHAHQAAQFGFGAHVAAESLDGVVVEAGFVEVRFGLHGLPMFHSFIYLTAGLGFVVIRKLSACHLCF